jgi:DNA-binding PucR family transcriptional regulator/GAF domain-containing protein
MAGVTGSAALAELNTEELAQFLEYSQGFARSLDLDALLGQITESARTLLGGDMSTLALLDSDRAYLKIRAWSGIDTKIARQLSTKLGRNLGGLVAEAGRALRTTDITVDPRSTLGSVCSSVICSSILVPLTLDQTVLGVLAVQTRERREFTDHDELVLALLASSAASAIETARLYQVERDHVLSLEGLVQEVHNRHEILRRTRESHDALTEASLLGVGRDGVVALLRERIPSPIVVTDQFGRRLDSDESDDAQARSLWAKCANSALLARQLTQYRAQAGRSHATSMKSGFWRLVPIAAAGELLGSVIALDHSHLDEMHMLSLEDAANILASELLRERSLALAEARAGEDAVRMIFSFPGTREELESRAALLGFDISSESYVVVLRPVGGERPIDSDALLVESRRAANRLGIDALSGVVDGDITVLLGRSRPMRREIVESWIDILLAGLATDLRSPRLRVGVSAHVDSEDDVRDGLPEARQAASFAALGSGVPLQYYEDVRLASLMDLTDRDRVETFVDAQIGQLIEYDHRRGADLLHTLEVYLDHSSVTLRAAKALRLHPHSLRYRLKRIGEIQGLDLEDPMTRLAAHLALKLRALG